MSFYNEILPFVEFLHSFRKLKNYFIFDMKFPQKWVIPKNFIDDGDVVPFELTDENLKGLSFATVFDRESIDKTLSKISKIINYNKEKELKERLFKQYVDKLKVTFESNDIEKLQSLHFEFDEINSVFTEDGTNESESEIVEVVGE